MSGFEDALVAIGLLKIVLMTSYIGVGSIIFLGLLAKLAGTKPRCETDEDDEENRRDP